MAETSAKLYVPPRFRSEMTKDDIFSSPMLIAQRTSALLGLYASGIFHADPNPAKAIAPAKKYFEDATWPYVHFAQVGGFASVDFTALEKSPALIEKRTRALRQTSEFAAQSYGHAKVVFATIPEMAAALVPDKPWVTAFCSSPENLVEFNDRMREMKRILIQIVKHDAPPAQFINDLGFLRTALFFGTAVNLGNTNPHMNEKIHQQDAREAAEYAEKFIRRNRTLAALEASITEEWKRDAVSMIPDILRQGRQQEADRIRAEQGHVDAMHADIRAHLHKYSSGRIYQYTVTRSKQLAPVREAERIVKEAREPRISVTFDEPFMIKPDFSAKTIENDFYHKLPPINLDVEGKVKGKVHVVKRKNLSYVADLTHTPAGHPQYKERKRNGKLVATRNSLGLEIHVTYDDLETARANGISTYLEFAGYQYRAIQTDAVIIDGKKVSVYSKWEELTEKNPLPQVLLLPQDPTVFDYMVFVVRAPGDGDITDNADPALPAPALAR